MRPTRKPIWATAGAIVEPSAGQKSVGWQPGQRPPAQHANWLANYTYQWIEHFDTPQHVPAVDGHADPSFTGWAPATGFVIESTTAGALWVCPLRLRVGDALQSLTVRLKPGGNAAGVLSTISVSVAILADGSAVASHTPEVSTDGTAWEDLFVDDPLAGRVLGAGEYAVVSIAASGTGTAARQVSHFTWLVGP
jgi:hypothetical protein